MQFKSELRAEPLAALSAPSPGPTDSLSALLDYKLATDPDAKLVYNGRPAAFAAVAAADPDNNSDDDAWTGIQVALESFQPTPTHVSALIRALSRKTHGRTATDPKFIERLAAILKPLSQRGAIVTALLRIETDQWYPTALKLIFVFGQQRNRDFSIFVSQFVESGGLHCVVRLWVTSAQVRFAEVLGQLFVASTAIDALRRMDKLERKTQCASDATDATDATLPVRALSLAVRNFVASKNVAHQRVTAILIANLLCNLDTAALSPKSRARLVLRLILGPGADQFMTTVLTWMAAFDDTDSKPTSRAELSILIFAGLCRHVPDEVARIVNAARIALVQAIDVFRHMPAMLTLLASFSQEYALVPGFLHADHVVLEDKQGAAPPPTPAAATAKQEKKQSQHSAAAAADPCLVDYLLALMMHSHPLLFENLSSGLLHQATVVQTNPDGSVQLPLAAARRASDLAVEWKWTKQVELDRRMPSSRPGVLLPPITQKTESITTTATTTAAAGGSAGIALAPGTFSVIRQSASHWRESIAPCGNSRCTAATVHAAKLKVCSGCHLTAYCSPTCQRIHWPEHRVHCTQLAKEAPYSGAGERKVTGAGQAATSENKLSA